jgi:hypothetical protein
VACSAVDLGGEDGVEILVRCAAVHQAALAMAA